MARTYGKIESGFWQNHKVRALSERGKLLLAYLFSCPHGNSIGCFKLPLGYAQDDMMWGADVLDKHMREVVGSGRAMFDPATSLVLIVGWFGHNKPENQNVAKGMIRAVNSLPHGAFRRLVIEAMEGLANEHLKALWKEIETNSEPVRESVATVSEPVLSALSTPKPLPEPGANPPDATHPAPKGARANRGEVSGLEADFETWWAQYPRRKAKKPARDAYRKARTVAGIPAADLLAGAMRYAAERQSQDPKFTAHPATWLNEGRWEDQPEKPHERNRPEATNPSGISDAVGSAVANAVARQVAGQRPNPGPHGGTAAPGPGGNPGAAGAAEHRAGRGGSGGSARMGQGYGDGAEGLGRGGVGLSGGFENHPGGPVIDGDPAVEVVAPLRQSPAAGERNPLPGAGGNGRAIPAEDADREGREVQGRAGGPDALPGHDARAEGGRGPDAGESQEAVRMVADNAALTDIPGFMRRAPDDAAQLVARYEELKNRRTA